MPDQTTVQLSQHSPFLHAVRGGFFSDPNGFLSFLTGKSGESWLRSTWEDIGQEMAKEDCPGIENVNVPDDDITVSTHDLGNSITATIITLPEPLRTPQPYFIALVIPPPGVIMQCMGRAATGEPRCFQLEASNNDWPFLCEWSPDGQQHRNYCSVREATVAEFTQALKRMVVA